MQMIFIVNDGVDGLDDFKKGSKFVVGDDCSYTLIKFFYRSSGDLSFSFTNFSEHNPDRSAIFQVLLTIDPAFFFHGF